MDGLEITDMRVKPCVDSRFIQPSRVVFKQNGVLREWDYIKEHDEMAGKGNGTILKFMIVCVHCYSTLQDKLLYL